MKDGMAWNKVEITAIARNIQPASIIGESTLTVSYTDGLGRYTASRLLRSLRPERRRPDRPGHVGSTQETDQDLDVDDVSLVQKAELARAGGFRRPRRIIPV